MKKVFLFLIVFASCQFIFAQDSHSDCSNAVIICSKDAIAIEELPGFGNTQELDNIGCSSHEANETNSVWFKWKIKNAGDFGFTIISINENNDIDFVLYRLSDGLDNCFAKEEIRCMASGQNRGAINIIGKSSCLGATGLSDVSKDNSEMPGCSDTDDNFLSTVSANGGETYALVVNNYYSAKGFLLEFTGTATFDNKLENCDMENEQSVYIQDMEENKLVFGELYPNPATNKVTISIVNNTSITYKNVKCLLVNMKGQILKTEEFVIGIGNQGLTLALDEIPKGTYFIKTEIGNNAHITRFVKM